MAKLRYAFFPGCTLESAAGELKVSTEKTCKALGIELAKCPDGRAAAPPRSRTSTTFWASPSTRAT